MGSLLSFSLSFLFFFLWPGPCGLGGLKFLNALLLLHPLTIAIYKVSKRGPGWAGVAEEAHPQTLQANSAKESCFHNRAVALGD